MGVAIGKGPDELQPELSRDGMTLISGETMINTRNTLGGVRSGGLRSTLFGLLMAIAAIGLLFSGLSGQEHGEEEISFEVTGQVVDAESGAGLVGAWVGLHETEWGALTDDDGRFRIPDVTPGTLELEIEQLGYETRSWKGTVANGDALIVIDLEAKPVLLEGLKVVSDRFRSRRNAAATSVYAFERDDLATSTARDALEFVEYRAVAPMTSCNGNRGDRCLVVRGRVVEPVVYVDEMPLLGGLAYLETFRPWELHMIEVYAGGRHIRAYTPRFMERAAERRLAPLALPF
ncbi:MAG: carboxypeptidase-like regulatory domain-containing protein [Gemmatimonadetes bacterium]|nr:carboxypeptidase-like regulatory domain-containing protein [Gemmatimonadota bacterium]